MLGGYFRCGRRKERHYTSVLYHEMNKGRNKTLAVFHKGGKGGPMEGAENLDARKTVREKKKLMFGQDRNFVRA